MTDANEFQIENGVLLRYRGADKKVIIPDGVASIITGARVKNKA
jgi:hypothetical protein